MVRKRKLFCRVWGLIATVEERRGDMRLMSDMRLSCRLSRRRLVTLVDDKLKLIGH